MKTPRKTSPSKAPKPKKEEKALPHPSTPEGLKEWKRGMNLLVFDCEEPSPEELALALK